MRGPFLGRLLDPSQRLNVGGPGSSAVRPLPDEVSAPFWEGVARGELVIQRCRACGWFRHWPAPLCKRCQSFDLSFESVSGRAELYSYAVTVQALHPAFAHRVPYLLAVVELEEQDGLRMVTNLVDVAEDDVVVGMPLEVAFRDVDGVSLPLFGPRAAER